MKIQSKFPHMKTTIFTQISQLANKHNAVNLGQGFPNFSASEYLLERLAFHTNAGLNQYAPMTGLEKLRQSIVKLHSKVYSQEINGDDEITVTSGATEAIFCAISAITRQDDEVIFFDPSYDSYAPNIELNGGVPVRVNLNGDFSINWELVAKNITSKTKAIILNSPHNPSGKCLTNEDLNSLWELVEDKNIFIISDEVYQHIIFDAKEHLSPFNDQRFRSRTFAISSFGKSLHATGWKVGYCVAPKELSTEFRKIHQYVTFSTPANMQMAISDMLDNKEAEILVLSQFYQYKRDLFQKELEQTDFTILPCEGSFFQLVDYSKISTEEDTVFCTQLIEKYKIATIPLSPFYKQPPKQRLIRFCFAKDDNTLKSALKSLQK
ncbi:methionine aminotransferase [Halobacteriovorax sp. HLS]|uniref:methionine aminotransferase n=1 Tax=Halobacteriovorax sp. HLS TaxID=2234000 RepID=UPI000FDA9B14|nr:methionine aminotransferase [Halobacteriovorax sp. HLS]